MLCRRGPEWRFFVSGLLCRWGSSRRSAEHSQALPRVPAEATWVCQGAWLRGITSPAHAAGACPAGTVSVGWVSWLSVPGSASVKSSLLLRLGQDLSPCQTDRHKGAQHPKGKRHKTSHKGLHDPCPSHITWAPQARRATLRKDGGSHSSRVSRGPETKCEPQEVGHGLLLLHLGFPDALWTRHLESIAVRCHLYLQSME